MIVTIIILNNIIKTSYIYIYDPTYWCLHDDRRVWPRLMHKLNDIYRAVVFGYTRQMIQSYEGPYPTIGQAE